MLNFPNSRKEVEERAKTDVQAALPESNPFLRNSFLWALISGFSGRIYDFYLDLLELLKQMFPDTAEGDFLERWGSYIGINRNPATRSTGNVFATGTAGTNIPSGTQLSSSDGLLYNVTSSKQIKSQSISISSITRSGTLATVTTSSDHNLSSLIDITISGANETEYNGTFEITVTSENTFTYEITDSPTTPATGSISGAYTGVSIPVRSLDFGSSVNVDPGSPLTFTTPLSGVDNTARTDFPSITGGTDQESDDDLRNRILFRYQNPVALFNTNAIEVKAKEVSGVTRVFVQEPPSVYNTINVTSIERTDELATVTTATEHGLESGNTVTISGADQGDYNITGKIIVIDANRFAYTVTGGPITPATGTITADLGIPPGQVRIYFVRDNDENIIPSAVDVLNVKNKILTIKPAHVDDNDVIVLSPEAVTVDFNFTSLSPDTVGMREAIRENLRALFDEQTAMGEDLLSFAYQSAIYQTVDPETGDIVASFSLSSPSGDITINPGQIPVLGSVTFT